MISGHLGKSDVFDKAIATFSTALTSAKQLAEVTVDRNHGTVVNCSLYRRATFDH